MHRIFFGSTNTRLLCFRSPVPAKALARSCGCRVQVDLASACVATGVAQLQKLLFFYAPVVRELPRKQCVGGNCLSQRSLLSSKLDVSSQLAGLGLSVAYLDVACVEVAPSLQHPSLVAFQPEKHLSLLGLLRCRVVQRHQSCLKFSLLLN